MNDLTLKRMDELVLPSVLDGSIGDNRCLDGKCFIKARNDIEAIDNWLDGFKNSKNTYKNYQREAERLLLWSVLERKKPLSSLDSDDIKA